MSDVEVPPVIDLPACEDIRRILIMKWSALGDIALASTVFDDIAAAFPGREIDINTMPPWQSLFAEDPRFGKVLCIGRGPGKYSLSAIYRWLKAVAAGRYDLIVDFQANDRSRLYLRLLRLCGRGGRYRMGTWPIAPYTVSAPAGRESTIDQIRDMLSAGGIPCRGDRPHLYIPEQNRRRAAQLKRDYGLRNGEFAVLLPGSQAGGFLKRWGCATTPLFPGSCTPTASIKWWRSAVPKNVKNAPPSPPPGGTG